MESEKFLLRTQTSSRDWRSTSDINAEMLGQGLQVPSLDRVIKKLSTEKTYGERSFENSKTPPSTTLSTFDDGGRFSHSFEKLNALVTKIFQNENETDLSDQFISRLLNNSSSDNFDLLALEAKARGYNFSTGRIAILIELKNFSQKFLQPESFNKDEVISRWKRKIIGAISSFFKSCSNDYVIVYLGNDKFLTLLALDEKIAYRVERQLKESFRAIFGSLFYDRVDGITVGFGNTYSGIPGIIKAFREADAALKLGSKLKGENQSYFFNDFGPLSALVDGDLAQKADQASALLSRLESKNLRKTLTTFLEENLNITKTAERLEIHRNTAIYRIEKIAKKIGLDPRDFEQAVHIKLALLFLQIAG